MAAHPLRIAALLAVLAVLVPATAASAFRGTFSPAGAMVQASLGALTFEGGISITCNVTYFGALSTRFNFLANETVGTVLEAIWSRCTGGEAWTLEPVAPWSLTLNSVPSGLPNELGSMEVRIHGFQAEFSVFGGFIRCYYRGDVPVTLALSRTRTASVYTTGLATVLTNSLSLLEGGFGCPSRISVRGTLGLSPWQTLTVS
jgi:hypothetical protein